MRKNLIAVALTAAVSLALPSAAQIPLSVFHGDTFQADSPAGWILPPGWQRTAVRGGFALRIDAAEAGLSSEARVGGVFTNVAVEGDFSFAEHTGTAQLFVRDSAAGSYVGHLD